MTKPSLLQVDLGTIIVMQPKIFIHALIRSPSKSLTPRVQLCPEPATNVQQFMITNALDHMGLSYPILACVPFFAEPWERASQMRNVDINLLLLLVHQHLINPPVVP